MTPPAFLSRGARRATGAAGLLLVACWPAEPLVSGAPGTPDGVERFNVAGAYPALHSVNDSLLCPAGGACGTSLPAGTYVDSSRTPARTCELRIGPTVAVLRDDLTFRLEMELAERCAAAEVEVDAVIAGRYVSFGDVLDSLDFDGFTVEGRAQAIIGGDVSGESARTDEHAVPEFLHLRIGNVPTGVLYRITLRR